ncbi:mitochondrial import inner membrane translocase subunit Tim29 [Esox lucius]|uniref:Translocase of inner mitochondrial membrane 29 n=1 Tax=Esox lucius TaxID=8010 RepID=A0A3P8Z8G5_ESOLU|nr:mitochondrial import inner membrane translocase subunit Tim29 [Esox lucius]
MANMASSWVLRRWCSTVAAEVTAPVKGTRWERFKQSKLGQWLIGMSRDYKEACREIAVGAWERPVKASVYLSLLGGAGVCIYTNPDDTSFETTVMDRANQLGLLTPWIRSGTSDGHVQKLVKLRNEGRLRHLSLGMVSLTYFTDYDPDASLYEAQCSNLSVPWRELHMRVLDVGFVGRWWILDHKMKDYDVNEEEFKHLPPAMAATVPPGVQKVEENERLHKESWMPLKTDEEVNKAPASVKEGGGIVEQIKTGSLDLVEKVRIGHGVFVETIKIKTGIVAQPQNLVEPEPQKGEWSETEEQEEKEEQPQHQAKA